MRSLALLFVCALAGSVQAQEPPVPGPPSKTLERAIKLYDKKDFFSASIELQKVLDGEAGDDELNKQRAAFFAAKTAYQMGFYAASWSRVASIASSPNHPYFEAAAKWLVALLRVVPNPSLRSTMFAYRGTRIIDDPQFASVRDELAYQLGRELAGRDVPLHEVVSMFGNVPPTSPMAPLVALELARVKLRAKDLDGGIAQAMNVARSPAHSVEATRLIASWTHIHGAPDRALGPLAQLAGSGAYARYQHSRAVLDGKLELPGLDRVSIETFDAVMLPAACRARWPEDIKPLARKVITEAKPVVAKLVAMEDNAELYDQIRKIREGAALPGTDVVLAAMADPTMQERIAWLAEINKELELVNRTDRAWQVTQAAAEVLQELVMLQSIEASEIGVHARQRLKLLARDLEVLEEVLAKASPAFALSAGPDVDAGQGLVVASDLCAGGGTAPLQASAAVRPTGCAGCATREASMSFLVLAALVFARIIRRARARSAPRRHQLHHDDEDHDQR